MVNISLSLEKVFIFTLHGTVVDVQRHAACSFHSAQCVKNTLLVVQELSL